MDAEALNSQVEEKKLRKAKKQSKVAAYGKSPRPGTSQRRKARAEWDKAGQFCFGVGPEAWGVVRQTRLTFGNSGCAEWALSLPWGLLHAPTHHPQVPTRCNMMWWLRYYRRNRQNGQVGWPRKCKFRKQKQQLKKRHELDFWDSDRLWREFPAHLGDNDPHWGPTSLQCFSGEDLDRAICLRMQQEEFMHSLEKPLQEQQHARVEENCAGKQRGPPGCDLRPSGESS